MRRILLLMIGGVAITAVNAVPIHKAARGGNLAAVKAELEKGVDVNALDDRWPNGTPLHSAKTVEVAEFLIDNGADVNAKDKVESSPLHYANKDVARVLIANGADVNALNRTGKDPMSRAISKGNKELVEMLIDAGVELNNGDFFHLHDAVSTGNQEVVLTLIDAGADVNRKTPKGDPPLNSTHHFDHFEGVIDVDMFELLLSKGAVVDLKVATAACNPSLAINLSDAYLKSIIQKMDDINEKIPATWINPGATLLDLVVSDDDEDLADFIRELGGKHGSIIRAAIAGNIDAVKEFLDAGVDVNSKSADGRTALDYADPNTADFLKEHGAKSGAVDSLLVASMLGDAEAVKTHLANGADIEMKNDSQETPLHLAAIWGQLEVVQLLIDAGADINARNEWGYTPLDRVSEFNQPELFEYLRNQGAKTHEWFNAGESIYIAAKVGHLEAVKQHITDGVDVDKKDDWSKTPLILATEGGHLEVVKFLIESGASIDAKDEWSGRTALILAAEKAHVDIVKYLIAEGANVKISSNGRYTALHDAAGNGLLEIVGILIGKGADVNASSNSGDTVLSSAVVAGHIDIVKLLIAEGADVNASESWGYTSLHLAVDRGRKEIIEILLENGANVNAAMSDGETPLFTAIVAYYDEPSDRKAIVELLIANGADVNVTSAFHSMPLDRAISRKYPEIAELLIRHGAMKRKEIKTGLLSYKGNGKLALYGHIGRVYVVEYSAELEEWKPKRVLTLERSPQTYIDGEGTGQVTRFYRMQLR